jgi:acetyl/propionyl-CoA carboxylase alpha subunit
MFDKVLIANRGAIACRIIRTLKQMNIRSVVVFAEADAGSLHVRMADEAYSLGEGSAAQTYLDQQKLFDIIARSGAQAVHPGYGFLSENPEFASRCEHQGVVFIGPDAGSMKTFGLKHEARALAEKFSVPLIPGTGLLSDQSVAIIAAGEIGYPIMLKSTAGGGGIGMQVCHSRAELEQSFTSVVRLSENNFANGGVFLEKYIARARHIEVQAFGDGMGGVIALGERDCSAQRRNQKVIEETPAPNLSPQLRRSLHDTAVALLAGVNYASAGTVEFIYDAGIEVSTFFDSMLAKVIVHAEDRESAIAGLSSALARCQLYGIETNARYARQVLTETVFKNGDMTTSYLDSWKFTSPTLEVIAPGTLTSIQDLRARQGYWKIGVPPSGPFDNCSFRLGTRLLGNDDSCAGLEITLGGPTLKFNLPAQVQSSLKQPLLYKKHPQVSRLILRIQTQENPDIPLILQCIIFRPTAIGANR